MRNPAPATPGPVILSVPHAGRRAPAAMDALLRVPAERLLPLEDRHADLLIAAAVAAGVPAIVAPTPRSWIDLNRREDEIDPAMVAGRAIGRSSTASAKMLGGLGLIPRRLGGVGEIWRGPLSPDDVRARIETVHRPYHAKLATALSAARAGHGRAVLLDVHSMPPGSGADMVVGDRHGRSASPELIARAIEAGAEAGLSTALNRPYAGGHILERHGDPARGVHAIQLELCRSLYLARDLSTPDAAGVARLSALIARLAAVLALPIADAIPLAAE